MNKSQKRLFLICAALILTTLIAFEPVRYNEFVDYDDQQYVTGNPQVKAGITRQSIAWAFTSTYAGNWHPLTWLSHMLDCELFGVKAFWHHLVSLLIHIANTLLLFYVLQKMTGAVWRSVFVAALFALHPLHVESVAWVAERKDVLSGLFWMLTMAIYLGYAKRPSVGKYLLILVAFGLGLMAKPMLVTLPFVLLLLDYWPLARVKLRRQSPNENVMESELAGVSCRGCPAWCLVVEKIPLFVLAAVSSVITYMVQPARDVTTFVQKGGVVSTIGALPLFVRISNAVVCYIKYIFKMVYPTRLAVLYPHPTNILPAWQLVASVAVLIAITAVVIYMAKRRRYLIVGWLWYLGTLVPVIGLVQVGSQAMADRYSYLTSIGFFIMIAWGGAELLGKWGLRRAGYQVLVGTILAGLLVGTRNQVRYWKDSLTLFGRAINVTENNHVMLYSYGYCLYKQGQKDEAITYFRKTSQINPGFPYAQRDLGIALLDQGKVDEAVVCLNEVLRFTKDWPEVYNAIGMAYNLQGKYNLAIRNLKAALRLKPDDPITHFLIGLVMSKQGKYNEALEYLSEALRINPKFLEAHINIGTVFARQGRYDQAVKHLKQALRLQPNHPEAMRNLRIALQKQGQLPQGTRNQNKNN